MQKVSSHTQTDKVEKAFPVILPPDTGHPIRTDGVNAQVWQKIENAVEPYRKAWMDSSKEEHVLYYQNIYKRLDYARSRCAELDERLKELYALNIGEEITPEIRKIESIRRPYAIISRSIPTQHATVEDYLNHIAPKVAEDFQQAILGLACKCEAEELDVERLEVGCVSVKKHSITLSFRQEEKTGFDATVSLSKASSIQRIPHVRCTVTELKQEKQQLNAENRLTDDGKQKPLKEKLTDVLSQVDAECLAMYERVHEGYYNNIQLKLPFAKERYDELSREIEIYNKFYNPKAKALKRVLDSFGALVNSEAAKHETLEEYMLYVRRQWKMHREKAIGSMTEKVLSAGMNQNTTKISGLKMTNVGVELVLTDKVGSRMDVQMTFIGGEGVQRPPLIKTKAGAAVLAEKVQADEAQRLNSRHLTLKDSEMMKKPVAQQVPDGLVTKAKIVEYNGKLYVTCHINGIKQVPVRILPDEWKKYIAQAGNDRTALAIAHYPNQIALALDKQNNESQARESSIKR